jgi:hypothetical protein
MAEPDLAFLAQQIERLINNDARQRDDMAVLTAIVMRLDGTVTSLLQEVRALHGQIARMNDRITQAEDAR